MDIQTLSLQHWDFFFLLAFLIGHYSIYRLAKVTEVGEIKEGIPITELVSELRKEFETLSTAAGINQILHFPSAVINNFKKK